MTHNEGDSEYVTAADGSLWESGASLLDQNHLALMALEDVGLLFLNGQFLARLDLSHNQDYGGLAAMGDFFLSHQGSPSFTDFNVWTP